MSVVRQTVLHTYGIYSTKHSKTRTPKLSCLCDAHTITWVELLPKTMRNIFCMWLYDAPCQVYVCSGTTSRSCLACDKTCSTDRCISSIDHGMFKNCHNATTKPGRFNVAVAHFICPPLNEWQPPGHRHLPVNTINVAAARSKPQEMHKGTFLPILYTQWIK